MLHAVIMAGGSGTRFWPESRASRPKQLLPITSGQPMLTETAARVDPLIPRARIWVVANRRQAEGIRQACPWLPEANLLLEPCSKNTAACVAYAAAVIFRDDPEAVLCMLPADHSIAPKEVFLETLEAAARVAERSGLLVTFGVTPTFPATGYGYIRRGAPVSDPPGVGCYAVDAFVEKPNRQKARLFLEQGGYYWNSGMFVWKAATILEALQRYQPELARAAAEIGAAWRRPDFARVLAEIYPRLPALPVDVAILEKSDRVLVLPARFRWSDVGSWKSLYDEQAPHPRANVALFPAGGQLLADPDKGILAYSAEPQLIAVLGLEDIVVVRTKDVILVARREDSEGVKDLVEQLKKQGREDLL